MPRKFNGDCLVLATHNRSKLSEIIPLFGNRGVKLSCAAEHGLESPAETGTTFLENATLKALFTAQATGLPALADDSGVAVDALGGAPGVYSADWAEQPDGTRNFDIAMRTVHEKLGTSENRNAAFVCCMVLAFPDGHIESVEERVSGTIIWPPRGPMKFGYDPIFVPEGYDKSYAELGDAEKNKVSHRAKAMEAMLEKCFT